MTICPDIKEAFKSDVLKSYGVKFNDMLHFKFTKFNHTKLSTLEQYQKASHNITELIEFFEISTLNPINGTSQTKVKYVDDVGSKNSSKIRKILKLGQTTWITQNYYIGRCYTYKSPLEIRIASVILLCTR